MKWVFDHWVWLAFLFSIFWAIYGYNYDQKNDRIKRMGDCFSEFIGSFGGWYCFYILSNRLQVSNSYSNMNSVDIFLIIGAFLGIAGYSFTIAEILSKIVKKLT